MKKILLLTLLSIPILVEAQVKFDVGFSIMQSFKKRVDIARLYQAEALSIYTKSSLCVHKVSNSLKGLISLPVNFGYSSITTGSVNNGPTTTTVNFEYDAALLYGVAGGSYDPEDLNYSDFGYFFSIGGGFVGLTQEPDYEEIDDSRIGPNLAFQRYGENKIFMNKISFGPVIHAGIKVKFHSYRMPTSDDGIAISFRPGFGNSLTYMQISIFAMLK